MSMAVGKVKVRKPVQTRQKKASPLDLFLEVPLPAVPKKKSFPIRCMAIIAQDIRQKIFRMKAVTKEPPVGWENYVRFLELCGKKGDEKK